MSQQNAIMEAFAQALAPHMGAVLKASGTPDAVYAYSEGGLFGSCKNDPVLINAMVGPTGYMGRMQWIGTITENPVVESLTYISSSTYSQSGYCGDCGKPTIRRCAPRGHGYSLPRNVATTITNRRRYADHRPSGPERHSQRPRPPGSGPAAPPASVSVRSS